MTVWLARSLFCLSSAQKAGEHGVNEGTMYGMSTISMMDFNEGGGKTK